MSDIVEKREFPTKQAAEEYGEKFLSSYPPFGYSSRYRVAPVDPDKPEGAHYCHTSRWHSCD